MVVNHSPPYAFKHCNNCHLFLPTVAVLGVPDSENYTTVSVVPSVTTVVTKVATVTSAETTTAAATTVTQATTTALPSTPNTYTFYTRNNDGSLCIIARMGTRFHLNITSEVSYIIF